MRSRQVAPTLAERPLVLVADNEPTIRDLLAQLLQRHGLTALCVNDGAAAVMAVKAHPRELVCTIIDIMMPVMNGIDAAYIIQSIAPRLPIIFISGAIPDEYAARLRYLRYAGLLSKPFSLTSLNDLLHATIGTRSALGVG